MADTDDVEVTTPDDITVELEGSEPAVTKAEDKPRNEKGQFVSQDDTKEQPKPVEDAAAKALQEAVDNAKRRAEAAEATAASERQRAEAAEAAHRRREAELQSAQEQIQNSELTRATEGIEAATKHIAAAKHELKVAMEAANFEAVAEAQTKLSNATYDLREFTRQKDGIDRRLPPPHEGRVEASQPAQPQITSFEQYVSGFMPIAQTWLRAHPECVPPQFGGKQDMNDKMMRGHYDALAQGHRANTPEYFRTIEESIGAAKKAETVASKPEADTEPKKEKRVATPAAPPSREPPGTRSNTGTRSVRLTRDEQEMAKVSFPHLKTDQERYAAYARNKLELESEGKLGRTTH